MPAALLDLDELSAPISAEFPAGEDVRVGKTVELYYRLKDARSAARTEERGHAPGEPFRLSHAWNEVHALAVKLLQSTTSDIEILAWLAEAELRRSGFEGLGQVFNLIRLLVTDRFEALHSIDGDDLTDKVAPFAGLNGVGGEGTLIQPIRLSSLVPGHGFFSYSLWDFQIAQRPGEEARRKALRDAATEAGPGAMSAHLAAITKCLASFNAMTGALSERCGADAPASSAIRAVLEEARLAVVNLGGTEAGAGTDVVPDLPPIEQSPPAAVTAPASAGHDRITSREDAFARLLDVAQYFRTTEPQSPISMAIETIVARGRMDFASLLAELVQDEHTRRTILITAGIRPVSDTSQ